MKLFITSSPFIDGADRAILSNENHFLDHLREALAPLPRLLYICADPKIRHWNCDRGAEFFAACFEAGFTFSSFQVLDGENAHLARELVDSSDLIVLSGGHVPTQNAFFRQIHLWRLLKHFRGTVIGISAGSMNMARHVYVQPEEPGESAPTFSRWAPGLGLTDVNILPHYQNVFCAQLDGLRLFEDITYADSMGHEFFALVDGSYFYQDDEHLLLCGEGYRLKNGIMEKLTRSGEILDMADLY